MRTVSETRRLISRRISETVQGRTKVTINEYDY